MPASRHVAIKQALWRNAFLNSCRLGDPKITKLSEHLPPPPPTPLKTIQDEVEHLIKSM